MILPLYIRLRNANKAESTLALEPRGDVTRNPKQWLQNRTCECVLQKNFYHFYHFIQHLSPEVKQHIAQYSVFQLNQLRPYVNNISYEH